MSHVRSTYALIRRTYEIETPHEYRYVTDTPQERHTYVAHTSVEQNTPQISAYRNSHRYASDTPLVREMCDRGLKGFLAHLSRRLTGELIVYPCSVRRPSVRPSSVRRSQFQRSSPLKPLGQSKPNFMWSILRKGERKFI